MCRKPTYQELEQKVKELEEERLMNQQTFLKNMLSSSPSLTATKQADKIKVAYGKYKEIYQNLPIPYHSLDINGQFLDVNPAWTSALGYERGEVIGRKFTDFIAPGYLKVFEKNFPRFIMAGEISNVPFKIIRRDYSYIYVELFGKIGYDENGDFLQTHCVFQDVSERKRLTEERERLIEELRKTIDKTKTIRSLLPICSRCKNIRDDKGYWNQLESYITKHTGALFSHSLCPDCVKKLYPEYETKKFENSDEEEDL